MRETKTYFLYGTLKFGECRYDHMVSVLRKLGLRYKFDAGFVEGRLYALPVGFPVLAPGPGRAYGDVMYVEGDSEAIEMFDAYLDLIEGYEESNPLEGNYYPYRTTIYLDQTTTVTGTVYYGIMDNVIRNFGLDRGGRPMPKRAEGGIWTKEIHGYRRTNPFWRTD